MSRDKAMVSALADVKDLHREVWRDAAPPATDREMQQHQALDKFRVASVELVQLGVTSLILEGAYLTWWLRVACINRSSGMDGFERGLARIGSLMGPINAKLEELGASIVDDGPLPEMALLGQRMEDARNYAGGGRSAPSSRQEEAQQTELALGGIQRLLLELSDDGIPPEIVEGLLLYFWFRTSVVNRNLKEAFFQTLERNWDQVLAEVNAHVDRFVAAL